MARIKVHAQRVAILLGALGILFSSVAVTILYFLQTKDQTSNQTTQQKLLDQLQQQKEAQAMNKPLDGYEATPFDAASVTKLQVEVLKQGDGITASASSTVKANYFGWTSDGKIFDSTNKNGTPTPISFPLSGVIAGWTQGLTGVAQGSVVKLIIPADQAYGSVDKGDGRPVGPLAFIVELKEVK